ncbi:MAG: response regulator [Candidatus Eisenbacteria bacterium]|nr:response regulator [Candidatus Eisenbacteria bacterium]
MSANPPDGVRGGRRLAKPSLPKRVAPCLLECVQAGHARPEGKSGYRVLTAGSGLEALNLCNAASPGIVVLDLRMPGLGGLDTAREISRLYPEIPVIIHTASEGLLRFDLNRIPARAFVAKSENLEGLRAAIAQVLLQRDRRQSRPA